jgi:hypothetical protein
LFQKSERKDLLPENFAMMFLFSILGLAQANDVLVPHFSAVELDDFAVATELEESLINQLEGLGLSVVRPAVLDRNYPELASSCFELEECPSTLLQKDNATLLIVGSVETTASEYNLQVRFYGRTSSSPLDIQTFRIEKEKLSATVEKISQDANVIFMMIPPQEEVKPEVVIIEKTVESSEPQVVIIEKTIEAKFVQPPANKVILSLPEKFEKDYYDSKLMPDEWLKQRRIRAMNVVFELHAGLAMGDVARSYDTRVGFLPDAQTIFDVYEYDTFFPGTGTMLGGAIGFAPLWWLELSLYGGTIIAPKELSTGWQMQDEDGSILQEDSFQQIVTSVSGQIEPRIRIFMLPSGPIKPYALLGGYFRVYDSYTVPDAPTVNYSNQPGGLHYGITTGGGLAFDSAGPVGVFLELPWTYVINQQAYESSVLLADNYKQGDPYIRGTPERPQYFNQIMGLKMGMSLRFD